MVCDKVSTLYSPYRKTVCRTDLYNCSILLVYSTPRSLFHDQQSHALSHCAVSYKTSPSVAPLSKWLLSLIKFWRISTANFGFISITNICHGFGWISLIKPYSNSYSFLCEIIYSLSFWISSLPSYVSNWRLPFSDNDFLIKFTKLTLYSIVKL